MDVGAALAWIELVATVFMTGLIWFVHVVHYPLLALVGADAAARYHAAHVRRVTWVVAAPMLAEAGAALGLFVLGGYASPARWAGGALLLVIWGVTAAVLVPAHDRLLGGFDPSVHRRLMRGDLVRALAWSARAGVLIVTFAGAA